MTVFIKSIVTTASTLLINYSNIPFANPTALPNINSSPIVGQQNLLKDTLIVPGKRVGAVTNETTYQSLVKLYGQNRLSSEKAYGAEGQVEYAATRVNLGSKASFTVVWSDASKTQPLFIMNFGSIWKTSEGIGIGFSFSQLRQMCGEFQVTGLYWDYGNTVLFKEGSRCSRSLRKITLYVDASPNAKKKFSRDLKAVMGEQTLSSTNPHWRNLEMRVTSMKVYLSSND